MMCVAPFASPQPSVCLCEMLMRCHNLGYPITQEYYDLTGIGNTMWNLWNGWTRLPTVMTWDGIWSYPWISFLSSIGGKGYHDTPIIFYKQLRFSGETGSYSDGFIAYWAMGYEPHGLWGRSDKGEHTLEIGRASCRERVSR